MTTPAPNFALIGRSFPSALFEDLRQRALAARRDRHDHALAWDAAIRDRRVWRGSGEPVSLRPHQSAR